MVVRVENKKTTINTSNNKRSWKVVRLYQIKDSGWFRWNKFFYQKLSDSRVRKIYSKDMYSYTVDLGNSFCDLIATVEDQII